MADSPDPVVGEPLFRIAEEQWFVLRVTYQREILAQQRLDELGIENFLPMRRVRRRNNKGQFCYVREVAVHNYIFARTTKRVIDELKFNVLPWLRYIVVTDGAERRLMTVPDADMRNFMAIAGHEDEPIRYLDNEEVAIAAGDRVRILEGPFAGIEGRFVRLKNARTRSVVVTLDGIVSVATTTIPASQVEKIEA